MEIRSCVDCSICRLLLRRATLQRPFQFYGQRFTFRRWIISPLPIRPEMLLYQSILGGPLFPRRSVQRGMLGFALKATAVRNRRPETRSEEHTSELQSLMRTSYAVFCLQKKK